MQKHLTRREFVETAAMGVLGSIAVLASTGCQTTSDVLGTVETTHLETPRFAIEITKAEVSDGKLHVGGTLKNVTPSPQLPSFTLKLLPSDNQGPSDAVILDALADPSENYYADSPMPSDRMLQPNESLNWTARECKRSDGSRLMFKATDLTVYRNEAMGLDILIKEFDGSYSYWSTSEGNSYSVGHYGWVVNRTSAPLKSPSFDVALVNGSDIVRTRCEYKSSDEDTPEEIPVGGFCQWSAHFNTLTRSSDSQAEAAYKFFEKHGSDYECVIDEQGFALLGDSESGTNATAAVDYLPCSELTYRITSKNWRDGNYVIEVSVQNETSTDIEPFTITLTCKDYHDKEVATQSGNHVKPLSHLRGGNSTRFTFTFSENELHGSTPDKVVIQLEALE